MTARRLAPGGLLCAGLLFAAMAARAADDEVPIDSGTSIELSGTQFEYATGFIVDRTMTHFGAAFVHDFSTAWRSQTGTDGVDLTIIEKPSARWGSAITVEYNNRPAAKVFLYAGRSATITPLAIETARYLAGKVADQRLMSQILRDPDLGKEELP